ncbi:MAG TPA: DUF3467 domain-containing protein [Bryobacterales bacterium]|nr:DUF3467 domain-containing protein [Bryobacterales bacterium]
MPIEEQKAGSKVVANLVRQPAANFLSIHTNNAMVNTTFFDIRITFGEFTGYDKNKDQAIVTDIVAVSMSPEHARALHAILGKNLEIYEKEFGPFRDPPETVKEGKQHTGE